MSIFVNQADAMFQNKRFGENNSVEHKTTNTALLDLFFQLVRNADETLLEKYIDNACYSGEPHCEIFVLLFQTRDCRGGKGEKKLFYKMFLYLFNKYPDTISLFLDLIPTYGYYKDFWNILSVAELEKNADFAEIKHKIFTIYSSALFSDINELQNNPENPVITLAGKYAPREQHEFATKHKALFSEFVHKYMFPDNATAANKLYRKLIVKLNTALQVTEVYMCAKQYSEINFSRVPSLCLKRFRKAFLNELVTRKPNSPPFNEETGDRFPDDPDRVAARQNLKRILSGSATEPTIKAKQLMPHEIVETIMKNMRKDEQSTSEKDLLQKQWDIIRDNVAVRGNFIPLVDVSSSMEGTPMIAAIALGILLSETTNPIFRDRVITFSTDPEWVSFDADDNLFTKVKKTANAPWGGSTNFAKAIQLILDVVTHNCLPASEVPDLIVFSDMQFDRADRSYDTHYEQIVEKFHDVGMSIVGEPYPVPRIVFWNLRATEGFPIVSDTTNTMMLSGFSPAIMKAFLSGENMETITPIRTLHAILHDERYDPIRTKLHDNTV